MLTCLFWKSRQRLLCNNQQTLVATHRKPNLKLSFRVRYGGTHGGGLELFSSLHHELCSALHLL
jgi:hypothetical protein